MNKRRIDYFETASDKSPVKDFIDKLSVKSQTKIYNTLELLAEFGLTLGSPHTK